MAQVINPDPRAMKLLSYTVIGGIIVGIVLVLVGLARYVRVI